MRNLFTLSGLALLACGCLVAPHAQAQKGGAQPDLRLPCRAIYSSEFMQCGMNRTNCLNSGTPSSTCSSEYDACVTEAEAEYKDCVAQGGQASTQPFLSFTPSAVPAAWNHSRQTRALLNPVSN